MCACVVFVMSDRGLEYINSFVENLVLSFMLLINLKVVLVLYKILAGQTRAFATPLIIMTEKESV